MRSVDDVDVTMISRPDVGSANAVVSLDAATLCRGGRTLWGGLDLDVQAGDFVAVLGPNGAGKSSLLKVLLGLLSLDDGEVRVLGEHPRRGNDAVGYVPQQQGFDADLGLRGHDLVTLGINGHRLGWGGSRHARERVAAVIDAVGARPYSNRPVGRLSGGEQQRLRIAQALVGEPSVLLCDEPLLSLDLHHQHEVLELLHHRRSDAGTAIVMVTHEINPVLPYVDKVLYLVGGKWATGTPAEVMTSDCLSELYGTQIDVIEVRGRLIVVGAAGPDAGDMIGAHPHHHHPGTDLDDGTGRDSRAGRARR